MASRLPPLPKLSDIVRLYKLSASKKLSQNFLLDMNVCQKFVKCVNVKEGSHICEIGPGPGGITRALLETNAEKVHVIEKDGRFLPSLETLRVASGNRLTVHHGDCMTYDIASLFPATLSQPWSGPVPNVDIVGNLPFNVSVGLLIKWLKAISERTGPWSHGRVPLTLTFQHEVARRMAADMSKGDRCRLSVMCQHLCKIKYKYQIKGKVFVPPPEVDCAVVSLAPLRKPLINQPFEVVEKVTRTIFHYRQKYIIKGARDLFPSELKDLEKELFNLADVDPTKRSFNVTIPEWKRLCNTYSTFCKEHPYLFDYDFRNPNSVKKLQAQAQLSSSHASSTEIK